MLKLELRDYKHFRSYLDRIFSLSELRKSTIREVEKKIEDANLIVSTECKVMSTYKCRKCLVSVGAKPLQSFIYC